MGPSRTHLPIDRTRLWRPINEKSLLLQAKGAHWALWGSPMCLFLALHYTRADDDCIIRLLRKARAIKRYAFPIAHASAWQNTNATRAGNGCRARASKAR